MRILTSLALIILVAIVSAQSYRLYAQKKLLAEKAALINSEIEAIKEENKALAADIEYFSDTDNLVKELKKLFNYKRPGEKIYIIVPKQ